MAKGLRLLVITALVSLAGCSQQFYRLGETLPDVGATLQPGASSAEVLALLGPPQRIGATDGGYAMGWEYLLIEERALGISLGPLGVDALSIDWGNARIAGEFLLLLFDQQHRLRDSASGRWDTVGSSGAAIQPSLGAVDVADASDLREPLPQHHWGAGLLSGPRVAANRENSPDTGSAGIEQRGTPAGIGQRSLE